MVTFAKYAVQAVIAVLLLASVGVQLMLPVSAAEDARMYPEVASFAVIYGWLAVAAVACIQVALVCLWILAILLVGQELVSDRGVRVLNVFAGALGVCAALAGAVWIHHAFAAPVTVGPVAIGVFLATLVAALGAALGVLAASVLRQASRDRAELLEVV